MFTKAVQKSYDNPNKFYTAVLRRNDVTQDFL